jgi:GNAT superfamily N-acetyltransferase
VIEEKRRGRYLVSTSPARLDAAAIWAYLSSSYWAEGRSRGEVEKSLEHSLCFGLYLGPAQIGLARVITDYATYAFLCDVYVLPEHQGKGLGKWLVECAMESEGLKSVKSWTLRTKDAHGLYRRFGFTEIVDPERWMKKGSASTAKASKPSRRA